MAATLPPPLKQGDTIGVMAPSSRIGKDDLDTAKAFLEGKGYKVLIHSQTYLHAGTEAKTQYAGSVEEKLGALHDLARDPNVKAVFFATGGQRALGLLDEIDYKLIAANPKIYMGFSDHTALVNSISARTGLVTYHGPTFRRFMTNPQADFNLRLLSGAEKSIPLDRARTVKKGTAKGALCGGNLAMIRSLQESDMPITDGGFLFLEEISEELTTVERDFCALRRRGILKRIGGLVLGQFTDMKDTGTPFGMTLDDIVAEHTAGLNIPVVMNAPFGHDIDLYALPVGQTVSLADNRLTLES